MLITAAGLAISRLLRLGRHGLGRLIHNQHLQPVFHVGIAGVRVQVQGQNLYPGEPFLQTLGYAPPAHMVGQASKGLKNDERPNSLGGIMGNFTGHQPALTAGQRLGNDGTYRIIQLLGPRRFLIKRVGLGNPLQIALDSLHCAVQCKGIRRQMGPKVPDFTDGRLEVLAELISNPGQNRLHTVALQILFHMEVGTGMIGHQQLARHQYPGLAD